MSESIAKLHILDVPYCADKEYDYYIPLDLDGKIHIGDFVTVPFGMGNRHMCAVCTGLADESEHKRPKPVFSLACEDAHLDSEQIELCKFLSKYTLCSFGEAVRTVIPAAALSKIKEFVTVCENKKFNHQDEKINAASITVYNFIKEHGKVYNHQLVAEFGDTYSKDLIPLLREGYCQRLCEEADKRYQKTKTIVFSALCDEDVKSLNENGKLATQSLRGSVQLKMIKVVAEAGEIDDAELFEKSGGGKNQLSNLASLGLVRLEYRDVYKNPYGDAKREDSDITLSPHQEEAYKTLCSLYESDTPKAALLHGVTGSGKTSVMKKMIDRVLSDGKTVIMLVPEIALTPQAVNVFCKYYGNNVAVLHSRLSRGEKFDTWRRIKDGLANIVIGTRSAIFAPLKNIGLIVIDEEQEHTYKSEGDPKYSAHDVARYRCSVHGSMMLLASATPSLSSYYKAASGRYTLVELTERYGGAVLPTVEIVDMRNESATGNTSPISVELLSRLSETVADGKQAIVFLNRRGYNSSVTCMSCGENMVCPRCSVSLTYNIGGVCNTMFPQDKVKQSGYLSCHYCGYTAKMPEKCPSCGTEHFRYSGCGTQKIEEELIKLVPGAKVSRMDMDTVGTKRSHEVIIEEFRSGKTNILLGTQMVTKGHDFPKVTLVGVIGADSGLYVDDFRSAERTFSMLTQVIGRAGRKGGEKGIAVLQTMNPYNEVIRDAVAQDYKAFYEREIRLRHNLSFTPFCDIVLLTLSSNVESKVLKGATILNDLLKELLEEKYKGLALQAFGPFEAPVYKIRDINRMRMVLKCRADKSFRSLLSDVMLEFEKRSFSGITLSVDINPASL